MKTFTNSTTCKNIKHECVQLITTDARHAYYYARYILEQRRADIGKPEVEDLILQSDWREYYEHDVCSA